MNDNELDLGDLLRAAERPRALTDAERHRLLQQLHASKATTPERGRDLPTELIRPQPGHDAPGRFAAPFMLAGASLAAIVILFVVMAVRDPVLREPLRPTNGPTATLPTPDDVAHAFCAEHVDAISDALVRWRSVENWAWARGEPDLAALVDRALESAEGLDDRVAAAEATAALGRLRDQLADIEPSLDDRDAVGLIVAAVEVAIDSLSSIASDLTPRCNVEQLAATPPDEA